MSNAHFRPIFLRNVQDPEWIVSLRKDLYEELPVEIQETLEKLYQEELKFVAPKESN